MSKPLIELKDLKKYFGKPDHPIKAVDGVSLSIKQGTTFGMVGESGCGKSTIGRTIIRLYEPTDGKIFFNGNDISTLSQRQLLPYRKEMQMIFQDPYASLNPRMTVGDLIGEGLIIHNIGSTKDRKDMIAEILSKVGLKSEHGGRYPHEFSGGQRQRIGIARALVIRPKFVICDEPISALDVSIQAQIINMLEDLQEEFNLTYLFIAHDLSMVKHISAVIGVMYLGKLVELGTSDELYNNPQHPYTKALISSVPSPNIQNKDYQNRIILSGEIPSPLNPPKGCPFHTRCNYVKEQCQQIMPEFTIQSPSHKTACWLYSS